MAYLVLEDGKVFLGDAFGADGIRSGQIVFNTCMTGYQEILTDPANFGNIVTMTYPEIGNVGVNAADSQSDKLQISGLVIRQLSPIMSNFRSEQTLEEYLKANDVVAIKNVDTRAIAKHLREYGSMYGVIACGERLSVSDLVKQAQLAAVIARGGDPDCTAEHCGNEGCKCAQEGHHCHHDEDCDCDDDCECECGCHGGMNFEAFPNLIAEVSCKEPYKWTQKSAWIDERQTEKRYNVVVLDLGVRRDQLQTLVSFGCDVTVVPYSTTAEEILALNPDGVFISNGPGAPWVGGIIDNTVEQLAQSVPVLAIGIGFLMLGMSQGINPCILRHGQHGVNIPVQDVKTKLVSIVSKNVDYGLDGDDLNETAEEHPLLKNVIVTHVNLNIPDVVEGFRHKILPIIGISWNPTAPTRPQDAHCVYDDFIDLMK
ncbi:MAG: carbamoyl phosphate synthase small subunit [Thermoguttaceae bacterium]|nr:carbamoyl phosphate synthase small subunit [Thermoguttaceae bacterium]